MMTTRARLLSLSAAVLMLAAPIVAGRQDPALAGSDPPANAVWVDSLDLSRAAVRRPRAQRGQTSAPALMFRLGGVSYIHALPLQSDGDLTIDLGGAATRFVATIGVDDGAPPPPRNQVRRRLHRRCPAAS